MRAENWPGPDAEDFVHVFLILEDDHPRRDGTSSTRNSWDGFPLADAFADMQQLRHLADYDHTAAITINEASGWLDDAEATILGYLQAALSERIYIATLTLVRPR